MRILLSQPWISYRGAEATSVKQCYCLNKLGHKAKVAAIYVDWQRLPEHGDEIEYLLPPRFISEICRRSKFSLFFLGPPLLFLVILRHAKDFEILNPHNLPTVWINVVLGKVFGKTVVWTSHGVPERVKWSQRKDLFDYLVWLIGSSVIDKWLVKKADVLCVTGSSIIAGKIKDRYRKDSRIIYPGIDIPPSSSVKLPKAKPLLLQVGALHSQKRQTTTLKVLKKLLKNYPEAGVVFVGDGPDRIKLEEVSRDLEIEDRVFFVGYVPQKKLSGYYLGCDLNLLPSVRETFPATPLEALALGVPSVISSDSGIKELVKDYVLVAEPSVSDTYKKVALFLKRKSYYQMKARKGMKFVKDHLTWEGYGKGFIQSVESLRNKEVDPSVYSKKYFAIHHQKPVSYSLKNERNTRLKRALDLLELKPGMRVLDLGCGNGELSVKIAKLGCRVEGVDYSPDAIKLAKKRRRNLPSRIQKRVNLHCLNAKKLPYRGKSFDRIVCLDVFEHIYPGSLKKVLAEMKRVVKPGGRVVVETSPNQFFLHPISFLAKKTLGWKFLESDEYHVNVYHYFRFRSELRKLGGKVSVDVKNDGHRYFSARIRRNEEVPRWMKSMAGLVDFALENPISEAIILNSPLKIFLGHDLWGTVDIM